MTRPNLAATVTAAILLVGCAVNVNPPLLFGDDQTFGLHLGNDTSAAGGSVSLGYKARSLAEVPLSVLQPSEAAAAIEAHSTKRGVIESTLSGRRWDYGVLVPGIRNLRAEVLPALNPPQRVIRLTQPLTRGDTVRDVQRRLLEHGFAPGSADGIYGPQTAFAVRHFQANEGLVADGEVGAATLAAPGLG